MKGWNTGKGSVSNREPHLSSLEINLEKSLLFLNEISFDYRLISQDYDRNTKPRHLFVNTAISPTKTVLPYSWLLGLAFSSSAILGDQYHKKTLLFGNSDLLSPGDTLTNTTVSFICSPGSFCPLNDLLRFDPWMERGGIPCATLQHSIL